MIIVDRPWPTQHEYKTKKFIVDFNWGEESNSKIPVAGRVKIEDASTLNFPPSKTWENTEDARNDVLTQTRDYIDRHM